MAYDQSIASRLPVFLGGRFYERRDAALKNGLDMEQARRLEEENARQEALLPGQLAAQGRVAQEFEQGDPARQLGARQSRINLGYLDKMYPGISGGADQTQNLPPQFGPVANPPEGAGPQNIPLAAPPPIMGMQNAWGKLPLSELRDKMANAGPSSEFMGQFLNPIIARRSFQEEVVPALREIADAKPTDGSKGAFQKSQQSLTDIRARYPALSGRPEFEKAIAEAMPKNPDFNPNMSIFNMDMGQGGIEFWADQLRQGKIGVDQLPQLAISQRARNKEAWSRAVVALAEKPAEATPENPSAFTPAGSHVGMKQATNPLNQRQLGFVETALPNIDRLIALSDKVERTGIPLMNAGIMKAKYNMGDEDVALLNNAKIIMTDELNQIFAGSQGGSDMSRHMAQALIDQNLDPATFRKTMQQVKSLLLTRKKAIGSTMGQYGPKVEEGAASTATSADDIINAIRAKRPK